nr:hypothetical protein [Halonotius aquaticus]
MTFSKRKLPSPRRRPTNASWNIVLRTAIFCSHDKKDFAGDLQETVTHAGIVVYTDGNYLRDDPEAAVRTLERVLAAYPPDELADALVWLDEWRR